MSDNPYQPPPSTGSDRAGGQAATFAKCPSCNRSNATKIGYTYWGGVLGPKLLSHVKCNECGTKYNGKSGKSNLVPIIIYSVVTFVIALAVVIAIRMVL